MSKVYRYNEEEKNNINVPWLAVFVAELEKQASGVDYLQHIFQKQEKFSSIEEKMADIKDRIGFDLINKVSEELEGSEVKTASSHSCACEIRKDLCGCNTKTAEYQHPKEHVDRMSMILKYIEDMANSEPHLDALTVISRCRDEEDLKFGDLRINMSKLKDYIQEALKSAQGGEQQVSVVYVPQEPLREGDVVDDVADYYRRSEHS